MLVYLLGILCIVLGFWFWDDDLPMMNAVYMVPALIAVVVIASQWAP